MKEIIYLSNGEEAIIDAEDYDKVKDYCWNKHPAGYAQTTKDYHCFRMHSLIMNTPCGFHTHHRNNNGLDNRKSNLQILTPKEHVKLRRSYAGKSNPFYGKTHNQEIRNRVSERVRKQVHQIDMISDIVITTFKSTLHAESITGINNSNISQTCNGKRNSAGGFRWKYENIQ